MAQSFSSECKSSEGDASVRAVVPLILVVDDDTLDRESTLRALEKFSPKLQSRALSSGHDLICYLKGEGVYADRGVHAYPCVVLLDLKMPEMDGFAALEWIRGQTQHSTLPVVALSGAGDLQSVNRAYTLGARSYLTKPVDAKDFQSVLKTLRISI